MASSAATMVVLLGVRPRAGGWATPIMGAAPGPGGGGTFGVSTSDATGGAGGPGGAGAGGGPGGGSSLCVSGNPQWSQRVAPAD
jgi:hypothetical protein